MTGVTLFADVENSIGESPIWLDGPDALYWVDAERHDVFRRTAVDGQLEQHALSVPVTALIPRQAGGWVLVTQDGLFAASDDLASVTPIVDPAGHDRRTRLNDGVADPWGRVWTGSMSRDAVEEPIGRLYLVGPDATVTHVDDGFAVANGIALSPDGSRLYVSDMFHRQIRVYGLDVATGELRDRLPPIPTSGPGYPDGLAIDQGGLLWVAYWAGARVERMDASGRVVEQVPLPVDHVTRCCLGGHSGAQLFVTTARYGLDPSQLLRQPHAGAVFTLDDAALGIPAAMAHL